MKKNTNILLLSLIAIFLLNCSNKIEAKNESKKTIQENEATLQLKPYQKPKGKFYEFGVVAKRLKISEEGEYFSSTKELSVTMRDMNGQIVWDSDTEMGWMQVIMPVLPETIGDTHTYYVVWNGKNNNRHLVKPGKYKLTFVLLTKPMSQITELEFDWNK